MLIEEDISCIRKKTVEFVYKIKLFFTSNISAPYENNDINDYFKFIANSDFTTLKSNLNQYIKEIKIIPIWQVI